MQVKLTWKQRLSCFIKGRLDGASCTQSFMQDELPENLKDGEKQDDDSVSAKQLLSILQKKGRLLDFLAQNLDHYDNEQVATVARMVHDRCKKALNTYCTIKPIYRDKENHEITLEDNYDRQSIELTGNIAQNKSFRGRIIHQGWKVENIHLPNVAKEANLDILQPAEVEVL